MAAGNKKELIRHMTVPFVAYWPELFTANERGKFAVVARFPKVADISGLEAAIDQAAKTTWPKGLPPKAHNPLRPQDEFGKVDNKTGEFGLYPGAEPGGKWMRFQTTQKPEIYDLARNLVEDENAIYSGTILQASIDLYAYSFVDEKTGVTSNGVSCFLNSAMVVHPGKKLFDSSAKKSGSRSADSYAVVTDEQAAQIAASAHF